MLNLFNLRHWGHLLRVMVTVSGGHLLGRAKHVHTGTGSSYPPEASELTFEQWFEFRTAQTTSSTSSTHPSLREDRFFDSSGPGGIRTPRHDASSTELGKLRLGKSTELPKMAIQPFAHNGYVYCMLLTKGAAAGLPYEEVLITGGGDGLVKLWSLQMDSNGRPQEIAALGEEDGDPVLSIIGDGTFLYSGRVDGVINVWDLETKQLLKVIKAGDTDVLALSVGRGMLFSSFVDGTVKVRCFYFG